MQKNLRRSSEICIFFQSSFFGDKYVLKVYEFSTIFGFLEKTSFGAMKICILTVLGINLGEKRWLGIALFLNVFRHWAKTFRPGSNMFMARKWKFHSTCGEVHFWGTIFRKCVIYIFSGVWAKNRQMPGNTFPAELSELHFRVPEEQCGCILFLKTLSDLRFSGFWVKRFRIFNNKLPAGLW